MRKLAQLCFVFSLLLMATPSSAGSQEPAWRIDLRPFGYQFDLWGDMAVRFSGRFLVVYWGPYYSRSMDHRLVFNKETRQPVSETEIAELPLSYRPEVQPWPARGSAGETIVAQWKQMTIEEVVTAAARGPDDQAYYLREPGKERVLLFRGRCPSGSPNFIGDGQILIHLCNGANVVVGKNGQKLYDLPRLSYPYIVPSRDGRRFAVYERDSTLFHQFEGTNRLRVKVFRSADGEKLFEYRWTPANERTNGGRVALSEDGSLVALIRGAEVLIFTVSGRQ